MDLNVSVKDSFFISIMASSSILLPNTSAEFNLQMQQNSD